jgi:four helix bundle protein
MGGWKSVDEIVAYQVSVKLRDQVLALIDSNAIPHNFRYRDDMAAAARSVPANISEGFDLYAHGRFGFHVGVAKGSLGELETHLDEARKRQFVTDEQMKGLNKLIVEARKTMSGLLRHLSTTQAPEPWPTSEKARHGAPAKNGSTE